MGFCRMPRTSQEHGDRAAGPAGSRRRDRRGRGHGAAIAFHLSRLGAGDVLVVDRGTAGSGMSSRSSAMIRMHYTFRPEVELAVRSDRMFAAWTELTGRPPFVRRTGFARIVRPGEEDALRGQRGHAAGCGAPRRGHRRRRRWPRSRRASAPTT